MTAAFNLTKWASNSELVMDAIDPAKRASSPFVEFNSSDPLKALGVSWDLNSDHFRFLAPSGIISSHDPMSKRSLLSLASKMFDPLGLISPFTVRAKILFQELWLKGLHWDDPLDSDIKAKWLSWKSTLATFIGKALTTNFSNLAFTTAAKSSSLGRDTVLMGATLDFDITSHEDTLPCLSLIRMYTAAPYALREASPKPCTSTAESCVIPFPKHRGRVTSFSCNNSVCWLDSMVALHWIKGQSSSWKPFVANRVAEIQSTWDPECWRYCASKENPADLLTRGLSCSDKISTLWWNGPQWMSSSCEPLPT
ncbi:uncharacterized protein [Montipora capricornis]|uniref:uncharacterized protein n=1 Tax=Montipora capricornis TaxID=246305 RepID=UPI0035F18E4B